MKGAIDLNWDLFKLDDQTPPKHIAMSSLRLGSIAPDFEAQTTAGPIKFHEWIGDSWVGL